MAKNPAAAQPDRVREEDYIPMDNSEQSLAVPNMEGYVLFWPLDRPGRIGRLLRLGWEFVSPDEISAQNFKTISGNVNESGSTDMGTRISVHGTEGEGGQSIRHYLMKLKQEVWIEKYEQPREAQSDRIAAAIKGRRFGIEREQGNDASMRYAPRVGSRQTLFDKKR